MLAFASFPILPRSRYIRGTFWILLAICLAACSDLLAIWCSIQARLHTTKLGPSRQVSYNSSQAAVLAVWLIFLCYVAGAVRSAFPLTNLPVAFFGIFQTASLTAAIKFKDMKTAIKAEMVLLEAFLIGIGLATAVSLLIFPQTCRQALFGSIVNYFDAMSEVLTAQGEYIHIIEGDDPWFPSNPEPIQNQHSAHKKALDDLFAAASRIRGEQPYAQRELAFGKLKATDISALIDRILEIIPAFSGLGFVVGLLAGVSKNLGMKPGTTKEQQAVREWQLIMKSLHGPFDDLRWAMTQAIEHILVVLQLKKKTNRQTSDSNAVPGSPDFIIWYDAQTKSFASTRKTVAELWYREMEGQEKEGVESSLFEHYRPFTIIYVSFLRYEQI